MVRTLSQITYTLFRNVHENPRVLTLHRYNRFSDSMRNLGLSLTDGGRVLGLQSTKGVYIGRDIVGYTWYVGPLDQPAPVFFGDSLSEIERFLWDELDRQAGDSADLPFLVGEEQGATMALAAAAAVPDLLSGVAAINPALPIVPGWEPPLAPLRGLPILLVGKPAIDSKPRVLAGDDLSSMLQEWGGTVTQAAENQNEDSTEDIANWISRQTVKSYGQ